MTRKEAVKNCPFCGSKVAVTHGLMGVKFYFFKCLNETCRATVSFDNDGANLVPDMAIDNWNRRVTR